MTTPQTLKAARELAAQNGILLSEKEEQYIQHQQEQERARLIATTPPAAPDMATRFNRFYPRLLQFILSIGETVLTFAQTLIVSFGVPLVLVLLLIVEHQRVVHGIALFEVDHALATFAAAALVLLNLVLEFLIHYIEHSAGYHEEKARKWSMRIWFVNVAYVIGYGKDWQEQTLSPAQRFKSLLRLVTFSILALALVGSMKTVMSSYDTLAWNEALVAIVTESNLTTLMTWVGGLLFAAAAVLAAQGLSRYVAIRCVEIIASMQSVQAEAVDPFAADVDQAGALALYSIITAKQSAKAEKAAKAGKPTNGSVLSEQPSVEAVVIERPPFGQAALTQDELQKNAKLDRPANMPTVRQQPENEYVVSENGNGHHS